MKFFIFLLGLFGTDGKPEAAQLEVDALFKHALERCEDGKGNGLFQKFHRRHVRENRHVIGREDPLKKRIYYVGACHKAGTYLLRNTMKWIFDSLGATDSCNYDPFSGKGQITSKATRDSQGDMMACAVHPVNVRWDNHITAGPILELRHEKEMFRGVMTIRDPFEMIVSAYCSFYS